MILNAIVIEDQKRNKESLLNQLVCASEVNVLATLTSVKQSLEYFSELPDADIIFSDVYLSDGLAFDIFKEAWVKVPVIFMTSSLELGVRSYENNAIDFLLKPVKQDDLERVLHKYNVLQQHFSKCVSGGMAKEIQYSSTFSKKTKLVVKKGIENVVLKLEDIVMIYTQDKVVYVTDRQGTKYISNKNLGELERELDRSLFFRISRKYILNVNYIKSFKSFEKVKLSVDISVPVAKQPIIISQETANAFRKWVHEV